MYADDSSLFLSGPSQSTLITIANQELKLVINWLANNKLSLKINKCKYIVFSRRGVSAVTYNKLLINQTEIECSEQIQFRGYRVDHKLSWKSHIQFIAWKIRKNFIILLKLFKTISSRNIQNLYYSFIYPYLISVIHTT